MADQRSKPRNFWEMWRVNQFKTQYRIPAIVYGSVELHDYKFMLISFVLFCDFSPIGLTCAGADKALLLSLKATTEGSVKIFFPGTTYLTCGCNTEYYNGLNSTFSSLYFQNAIWDQVTNEREVDLYLMCLVTQSVRTLCDPWIVAVRHLGISQVRILERVTIPFSRGSSPSRNKPWSPALQADSLPSELPRKPRSLS